MTFKVYRWDDADAPVLDTSKGSMINVLEKCLVTGYGTNDQVSDPPTTPWNVDKSADGLHAVFYSGSANWSGAYLYVRDDGEWDSSNSSDPSDDTVKAHGRECYAVGALTFNGFTNGKPDLGDKFPRESKLARGVSWPKNGSTTANGQPWMVIADSRTAYILIHDLVGESNGFALDWGDIAVVFAVFGDVESIVDQDDVAVINGWAGYNLENNFDMEDWYNPLNSGGSDGKVMSLLYNGTTGIRFSVSKGNEYGRSSGSIRAPEIASLTQPSLWDRSIEIGAHSGNSDSERPPGLWKMRGVREFCVDFSNETEVRDFWASFTSKQQGDQLIGDLDFGDTVRFAFATIHGDDHDFTTVVVDLGEGE